MTLSPDPTILDAGAAQAANAELFSEISEIFRARKSKQEELFRKNSEKFAGGIDVAKLIEAERIAGEIATGMFATRYGVGTKSSVLSFRGFDFLEYHNAQHTLDIIGRLDKLFEHHGLDVFPPERRTLLTLFAAFHDLRQRESGKPENGIGANERASAKESVAIIQHALVTAGFDREQDAAIFQYFEGDLELMIYGTTFNFVAREESVENPHTGETTTLEIPCGALAPMTVKLLEASDSGWTESARGREQRENILLGSDVDTANVADDFFDFAVQGVNLCRELEKRKGNLQPDAAATYGFMTGGQEYYFNVAQRFNTELCSSIFLDEKKSNGVKLKQVTARIRELFGDPDAERKTVRNKDTIDAESIMTTYLELATQVNNGGL